MPPSEIQRITRAGQHVNTFAVGDLFPIRLDGTVGICDVSGDWYTCLIGIDHNSSIEGEKSLHFQFPYNETGKGLAFVDEKYEHVTDVGGMQINTSSSKVNPYLKSYMHLTICPNFYKSIQISWNSIISVSHKWRDSVGDNTNLQSNVWEIQSRIWLLAEFEVAGVRTSANVYEQDFQKQYSCYSNGNSRIKYKHNVITSRSTWWLSSVDVTDPAGYRTVREYGDIVTYLAYASFGVAPCFKVA